MDLIPQLIGVVIGILGGYSLLVSVRKRYPSVDAYFKRLTGQNPYAQASDDNHEQPELDDNPLNAANWQVRRDALLALTAEQTEDALPALLNALTDADLDVRETAGTLLAQMGDPAIDGLITVMENGQMEARIEAAKALGEIADTQATACLAQAVQHDDSVWVRAAAAEALGKVGGDVLSVLTAALDDDAPVREAAVRGLQFLDTRPARKLLRQRHLLS